MVQKRNRDGVVIIDTYVAPRDKTDNGGRDWMESPAYTICRREWKCLHDRRTIKVHPSRNVLIIPNAIDTMRTRLTPTSIIKPVVLPVARMGR